MTLRVTQMPISPTALWEAINGLRRDLKELAARRPTLVAWTALPYASGWSDFGGTYQVGQYQKLRDGTVEIQGVATYNSTPIAGTIVATLPSGCRPAADVSVGRIACGTAATATVDLYIRAASGNVEIQNPGGGTFASLPLALFFRTT